MKNLVIGSTSQLAYYFPSEYIRVSSRNLDLSQFDGQKFDRVFITFAEQRLYITDNLKMFIDTNVEETLRIIKYFQDKSNFIVTYGSCELWNYYSGPIDINMPMKYLHSHYCISKEKMVEEIHNLNAWNKKDNKYTKIIVLHPFNFNSPYRKKGFLFNKIYDSVINESKITIGNTYFYRDMIHPRYVVERSINATEDEIVGSGRLTYVNDFIKDIYNNFHMDYNEYVTEDFKEDTFKKNTYYLNKRKPDYKYKNLIKDTTSDINNSLNKKNE